MINNNHEVEAQNLPPVEISTDGSCSPNPGQGAWAAILIHRAAGTEHRREVADFCPEETTSNRMELTALIGALKLLKHPSRVTVRTDSRYVAGCFAKRWWNKIDRGGAVPNADLWLELQELSLRHEITCVWVKGHAEDVANNRCDELAMLAAKRRTRYDRRFSMPLQSNQEIECQPIVAEKETVIQFLAALTPEPQPLTDRI